MEKTTKEQMSEYLGKGQLYQRLSQGIIDVTVEIGHGVGLEFNFLCLRAWKRDPEGNLARDEKGDLLSLSVNISSWQTKRQNDSALLEMKNYLIKAGVEL